MKSCGAKQSAWPLSAIFTQAADHGHTVEFLSGDATNSQVLADQLAHEATVGQNGARSMGELGCSDPATQPDSV